MSEAAREAGYSPALQNQACVRIEPKSQLAIKEALLLKGVGTERIAGVIEAGLSATKPVKDFGIVDDYKERREYARLSLEALGELKTSSVNVQINFPSGLSELLQIDAQEYIEGEK